MQIVRSIQEANLLRARIRHLLAIRNSFLRGKRQEDIHDLRVASRRLRELLQYLQPVGDQKWCDDLIRLTRVVTKKFGPAREAETCIKHLEILGKEGALNPFIAELLVYRQWKNLRKSSEKAYKFVAKKNFSQYEKFISRMKGSRRARNSEPLLVRERLNSFRRFDLTLETNDETLHDLRIRTKKLRYAVEIYQRFARRNFNKLLAEIRALQEVLGEMHDLYILESVLWIEKQEWEEPGLPQIAKSIGEGMATLTRRKEQLKTRVEPLYSSARKLADSQLATDLTPSKQALIFSSHEKSVAR